MTNDRDLAHSEGSDPLLPSIGTPDLHKQWAINVAAQYSGPELDALNSWLDTNIQLEQSNVSGQAAKLVMLVGAAGVIFTVVPALSGAPRALMLLTSLAALGAATLACMGLRTVRSKRDDATTAWEAMWQHAETPRASGQLQAVLHRGRIDRLKHLRDVTGKRERWLIASSVAAAIAVGLLVATAYARSPEERTNDRVRNVPSCSPADGQRHSAGHAVGPGPLAGRDCHVADRFGRP